MVIIDWNCQGKFREKHGILKYNWDILAIQECEDPEYVKNKSEEYYRWARNHHYIWKGDNHNKGVGIFSKNNNMKLLEWPNEFPNGEEFDYPDILFPDHLISKELKYFVPVNINEDFMLLNISTKKLGGTGSTKYQYTGLITQYLKLNKDMMINKDIIIVGDFNNNIRLCEKYPDKVRFKKMMAEFDAIEYESLYHISNNIKIGEEQYPTRYYSGKNIKNRPDHIDYCFVSKIFKNGRIKVAQENEWKLNEKGNKRWEGKSDHCPIIIEF
jgi:exonuclease III